MTDPFARLNAKLAPLQRGPRLPVTCAWCGKRGTAPHSPACSDPAQRRARGEPCQYGGTPDQPCRSNACGVCP